MLHSKLMAMSVRGMTKATVAANRLQFVIENSVNGSIAATTTYSPRRYQHVLCGKSAIVQPLKGNIEHIQYHSVLSKASTSSVSVLSLQIEKKQRN